MSREERTQPAPAEGSYSGATPPGTGPDTGTGTASGTGTGTARGAALSLGLPRSRGGRSAARGGAGPLSSSMMHVSAHTSASGRHDAHTVPGRASQGAQAQACPPPRTQPQPQPQPPSTRPHPHPHPHSHSHSPQPELAQTLAPTAAQLRKQREDESIRSTDGDALGSRVSAIKAGYFGGSPSSPSPPPDEFSDLFYGAPPAPAPPNIAIAGPPVVRRPPVINIGTYLRCVALDRFVEAWLLAAAAGGGGAQIVSVGAGSDARYWRLVSNPALSPHLAHYLELDFPQVVGRKIAAIQRYAALHTRLEPPVEVRSAPQSQSPLPGAISSDGPSSLHSKRYTLQSVDLRHFSGAGAGSASDAPAPDALAPLDPHKPTLILAECVLAYMPPEASCRLLERIAAYFSPRVDVAGVCYEMCVAGDAETGGGHSPSQGQSQFGRVMLSNLEARGLSLLGARAFPTPTSHAQRFASSFQLSLSREDSDSADGRTAPTHTTHAGSVSLRQVWKGLPGRAVPSSPPSLSPSSSSSSSSGAHPSSRAASTPTRTSTAPSPARTPTPAGQPDSPHPHPHPRAPLRLRLRAGPLISPAERDRLSRVEGLDEVEELEMLLSCYCISWGVRVAEGAGTGERWREDVWRGFHGVGWGAGAGAGAGAGREGEGEEP